MRFISRTCVCAVLLLQPGFVSRADDAIELGTRRELFVDDSLLQSHSGVSLQVQRPDPKEVVLVTDAAWEGNTCAYYTIFEDNGVYRMYYRGSDFDEKTRKASHREVTCYAESRDGITWTKPSLGLYEFEGSKDNNIVWDSTGTHDFTPFKDPRADCPPEQRYKALARGTFQKRPVLYAFQSPDGIHWTLLTDEPVITRGAFDSQNLGFWDEYSKCYRAYFRDFRDGHRDIRMAVSQDFVNWSEPEFLSYNDARREHLYTNTVQRYPRAPQLLIGFPTRYHPERGSQVEPIFMSSRDGRTFHRFEKAVIPVTAPRDRDGNRSNYMTWGLLELPDRPESYSVYATEAYYTGPDSRVRRFEYRKDGFVALSAGGESGQAVTKPVTFTGTTLHVNLRTGDGGVLRVELQNAAGEPLPGFALEDSQPLSGDGLDLPVTWKSGKTLETLAGTPVRLRFQLQNAELFAFRAVE